MDGKPDLETVLAEAIRALTVLDAEAIEALADLLTAHSGTDAGRVELPRSPAEWARLGSRRSILAHLLDGTGRRLEMLRQVSSPELPVAGYGRRPARPGPRQPPRAGPSAGR